MLPSIGWLSPGVIDLTGTVFFIDLCIEIFRFESNLFSVILVPGDIPALVFSENSPAEHVDSLQTGIGLRNLVIDIQWHIERQQRIQLILNITVEISDLFPILAAVDHQGHRWPDIRKVDTFQEKACKKIVKLLLSPC